MPSYLTDKKIDNLKKEVKNLENITVIAIEKSQSRILCKLFTKPPK